MMQKEALKRLLMQQLLQEHQNLTNAMDYLKFIQYDPIKKPLQAQDLILLQRVRGYRPKDLEKFYPNSTFEEDRFYVYGVLAREFACLLHPRFCKNGKNSIYKPQGLAADVLNFVKIQKEVMPREVIKEFGKVKVRNVWGGISAASTHALEELHYYGLIRVSRRVKGGKFYAPSPSVAHNYSPKKKTTITNPVNR